MRTGIAAAIGAICVLAAVGAWTVLAPDPRAARSRTGSPDTEVVAAPDSPPSPLGAEIAELRQQLTDEVERRAALEREVASLRVEVAELRDPPDQDDVAAAASVETERAPAFNEASLTDSGLNPDEVAELRDAYEQAQLDRLYLRDQAVREGWFGDRRFMGSVLAARQSLQEELGRERFDWMTYAAGQNNRVEVREIIRGSVADAAGLQAGDLIVAYAELPIYAVRDLRVATAGGELGDPVVLVFERDERVREVRVERGPLGAFLDGVRRMPPSYR